MDEDHDTYGDVIPDSGPLSRNDDVPSSVYDRFEYKIPGNADGARDTQNSIPYGSSAKITIPSGTYDYVITNPTPDDRVWIVGNGGTDKARMDDYVFEAGKVYTYTVSKVGSGDGVYLSIHEHSYSNSIWNSDESGHWQECDDTNCPDKASSVTAKTAHISMMMQIVRLLLHVMYVDIQLRQADQNMHLGNGNMMMLLQECISGNVRQMAVTLLKPQSAAAAKQLVQKKQSVRFVEKVMEI